MLVHLLRHFAFDRFHGFRWFSWITGVGLIWLVYLSGINGYMLPWDRLAQFVIVASFEWLDWLPSFGGTLMRNFIHPGSVGDRFFSLLSFMHIGLPLVVLLLMWVHVQRVPKARTTPPRPIVWSLLATLGALSLLWPVLSQGGAADLGTAVTSVQLDWFYLPLFPLIDAWPLGRVWALALGGTALLVLLPWWPPKFRRGGRSASGWWWCTARPAAASQLHLREGETLLEGGLRVGLALPYECRNGGCGKCLCSIEHGRVEHRPYQRSALPDALKAQGKALMCCAVPLEDVVIEVEGLVAAAAGALQPRTGRVVAMRRLADDVMRVLIAPDGEPLAFTAGQYINIVLDDGQRRAFSFANPPHERRARSSCTSAGLPGGRFTGHVFDGMQVGRHAALRGTARQLHAEGEHAADPVRGRRDRLRAGQEHPGGRIPPRRAAADAPVLGRAATQRPVPAGTGRAMAARARQFPGGAGAVRAAARRPMDRAAPAWCTRPCSPITAT